MKKLLVVLLLVIAGSTHVFGQLGQIEEDFSALLQGLADNIEPYLQLDALNGDGIGSASLGDSRFFVSVAAGAAFTPGLLSFLSDEDLFDVLDVGGLLETAIGGGDETVTGIFETLETFFLLPSTRLGLGIRLPWDIETLLTFSILPQALIDAVVPLVGLEGLTLSNINIGGKIRKTLVKDVGGLPALSVGAGFTYADFGLEYPLSFTQDLAGDELVLDGALGLQMTTKTAGVDVALSKRLLFFIPFMKVGAWYQWTTFAASGDFDAEIQALSLSENLAPTGSLSTQDLSVLINAGFELKMGRLYLVPEGTFNTATGTLSAEVGMRLQF